MNAAGIQKKINRGWGIAARKLGETCDHRRPVRALVPVGEDARLGWSLAYFDPDFAFGGKKPNLYGKAVFGVGADRYGMQVGDYLFAPSGTYFLAGQEPLLPTVGVQCNVVVSVSRPGMTFGPGINAYSGRASATDTDLMTDWPASILTGGRTQGSRADLPGDVPNKGGTMLLPHWPGVTLRTSDRVTDSQGRAFDVSSAELTDLGWRMELVLAVA